jgi:hypothetical protein
LRVNAVQTTAIKVRVESAARVISRSCIEWQNKDYPIFIGFALSKKRGRSGCV